MTSGAFWKRPSMRLSGFFAMLLAVSFLALSVMAYAEEITYTGDGKSLRDSPSWFSEETDFSLFPGSEKAPLASDNSVIINYNPKAVKVRHPEFICGGMSMSGDVAGNTVSLLKGRVDRDNLPAGNSMDSVYRHVYGGYSCNGSATYNSVAISGGSVMGIVYGGYSQKGREVANNAVTISGGSVGVSVVGGWGNYNVTHNAVIVSGGYVGLCVSGAWSYKGDATGNTVTISGRPDLAKALILGGYTQAALGDEFTGNTLNIKNSGISAVGVGNFEYYNFYLPKGLKAGAVMITAKERVNLADTTVAIVLQDGAKLKKGYKIALIHSAAGVSNMPKNKNYKVKQGGALYDFSIYTDKNNLWAEVTKISKAE